MGKESNILSEKFIFELRQATSGYLSLETFKEIINAFENELKGLYFSPSIEANLHRIIFSLFDKISFLSDCLKYPYQIQILLSIAINSNFLTDVIVRNPEFLSWILSPDTLSQRITEKYIQSEIENGFERFKSFNTKVNYLRTLKRRELLRIGLNDILGNYNLLETTGLLSVLAKSINKELFQLCFNETAAKYNLKTKGVRYCLSALGKLGGDELNYSSDIDLILFFDKNSIVKKDTQLEYYEVLNQATFLFIQTSTALTEKGYLYRVDFRLRPDGRNSPLCRTLKDYIQYYETRGEDWERQMLIKLSFVSGNKRLFNSFSDYLQHFIFPSSFSTSPLNQIARIKSDIEKKVGEKENVKLFSGGIRDIEFSLQALQMLNAGRLKELRTGNSLIAIEKLNTHNLLSDDEAASLKSAYIFYRKIEHFLQLMNDKQTHLIPDDEETLNRLSHFMNFRSIASFRKKIENTREQVRLIYDSIIGQSEPEISTLDDIHFIDIKKSSGNFKYLQTGQGLLEQKQFDKQTINAFSKVEKTLLDFLKTSASPDLVLDNFSRIIKSRGFPSIWYNEFVDPVLFKSFLKICGLNKKAVELLVMDASLSDLLLSRKAFIEKFETADIYSISQCSFILAVQFCLGIIETNKLSNTLSTFLLGKIRAICQVYTLPRDSFIFGLGSFGSNEMTFGSDIDLVFVVKDLIDYPDAQDQFQKLFLKLQSSLKPFTVDDRLRPEGKNAQLVWDLETYFDYLAKRIQNWELQALTRIKFVHGNEELFKVFLGKVIDRIRKINSGNLSEDLINMRSKMEKQLLSSSQAQFKKFFNIKRSYGGLTDIEFAIQFQILTNPDLFPDLIGKDLVEITTSYSDFSSKMNLHSIIPNYLFLKRLELWTQILFDSSSKVVPLDESKRALIANAMSFDSLKDFEDELSKIKSSNRQFFENKIKI